ncbi:hypothetical protein G7046_g1602 [Stylonectria norvegica]|nr:hypothetical protein G7046_g1602 [Stylonectria norvegica]
MKPTTITSIALVAATQIFGAFAATAAQGVAVPSTLPVPDQLTSQGCFKSGGNLTETKVSTGVSSGSCGAVCKAKDWLVSGMKGDKCYCGMVYPPSDDVTSDKSCNYPCPGYGKEACGSLSGAYSIFNTGVDIEVDNYDPAEEKTSTSSSAAPTSTKSTSATTSSAAVTTTAASTTETPVSGDDGGSSSGEKKKGPNVAAIAAGVVVGVVVMGAILGGLFFVVRRKRNAEIEEEHRRNAAVNAFINGSKPPSSSGSISMTDSRLDPVLAHRRMSDGSIADNQDYSRRILRVTNA